MCVCVCVCVLVISNLGRYRSKVIAYPFTAARVDTLKAPPCLASPLLINNKRNTHTHLFLFTTSSNKIVSFRNTPAITSHFCL